MSEYRRDITKLKTIKGKTAWLLETYPNLRNANDNELWSMYWKIFHHIEISPRYITTLTATASIERAKRKLVEKEPYKYGPTQHSRAVSKGSHQLAIEEWVTQN